MTFKTVLVKKWTIMLSGRVRGKHVIYLFVRFPSFIGPFIACCAM
jgi:hypothetical protein